MKYIIYLIIALSIIFPSNKSTGLIKNLILPGWGFVDTDKDKARGFLLREMIIWSSLFSSRQISDIYEGNYIAYGINHANTNVSSFGSMYSINVGNYNSIYWGMLVLCDDSKEPKW